MGKKILPLSLMNRQNKIATMTTASNSFFCQNTPGAALQYQRNESRQQLENSTIRLMATTNNVHVTLETAQSNNNQSTQTAIEDSSSSDSSCSHGIPLDNEDEEDEQEEMFVVAHPDLGHGERKEWGGPRRGGKLPEPTRFGDWERKGRCTDF